jgi:hypothetical protein
MAIVPRCRRCGSKLIVYDGQTYCPDCTSYVLPPDVRDREPARALARPVRDDTDDLRKLAARVGGDPWFLGWAIEAYQRRHGLDDAALADELGALDTAVVAVLRLCRRPGTAPGQSLAEDVAEVARRFAVDPAVLRRILSEAHR